MKKVISIFAISCCLLTISGCGDSKPDDIPQPYYKAAVQFIDVLDQVLDVEMDFETAYDETEYYVEIMEGYGNYEEIEDREKRIAAYGLAATALSASMIRMHLDPNCMTGYAEEGLQKLLEDRNDFAENFNIKIREE